jgi:hypothetical protein
MDGRKAVDFEEFNAIRDCVNEWQRRERERAERRSAEGYVA